MKRILIISIVLVFMALSIYPVTYEIHGTLNTTDHSIKGVEEIVWTNTTSISAESLQLHLYQNAFSDDKSTFSKEAPWLERMASGKQRFSRVEIHQVKITDGPAVAYRYISPDDGNPDDRTVLELLLPRAVRPGESISIHIEWTTFFHEFYLRSGYARDYYQVMQWYPKLGVFTDSGWNCHQYHASSEYFANFADYEVTLQIPEEYILAATALVVETRESLEGKRLVRMKQENIHDFAFVCGKGLKATSFEHNPPGGRPILINLYLPTEYAYQESKFREVIERSFDYYHEHVGPYPYRQFSVVAPPWHASQGRGGMEYPTLIIAATRHLQGGNGMSPDYVIAHEFGHQYFYGVLGSNEVEHPWLDEGLTSYTSARLMEEMHGEIIPFTRVFGFPVDHPDFPRNPFLEINDRYYTDPHADTGSTFSFKTTGWSSYRANAYNRPAMLLKTMENHLGQDKMNDLLSTYFQRFAFQHPKPEDFLSVVEEIGGNLWVEQFEYFLDSNIPYDLRVESLSSREVLIVREGNFTIPVEITFTLSDDRVITRQWEGKSRWVRFRLHGDSRYKSVHVDPYHSNLLDLNPLNNARSTQPDRGASWKFGRWLLFTVQNLLEVISCAY